MEYKEITDKEKLAAAYTQISGKKGANTKAIDKETLDGYSMALVEKVSQSLKDHTFKFKPIRRVYIPKPNGDKRPIGIPSPRDKVVQRAMVNVLEKIYEPIFLNSSNGFRPERSTHTAIKAVTGWSGVRWFIEGDIKKYYDTINHHKLAEIMSREIKSKEFMDLYWKAVKAHYINPLTKEEEYGTKGIPQGGTISAILSNIYLHEFDKFMEEKVIASKESGPTTVPNPEYKKFHTKISNLRAYFRPSYRRNRTKTENEMKERLKEIKTLEKQRAKLPSTVIGPGYRIYYVRYADDFLVGVTGNYSLAENLREEIRAFLESKLDLQLNMEKTAITHSEKGVNFLGARLIRHVSRTNDQKRIDRKVSAGDRKTARVRVRQGNIIALAPLDKIVKKLADQGMCRIVDLNKRAVVPTRKTSWMNLELGELITKYNQVWNGILNYYCFAKNRSQLNFIQFIIQHSAACSIMNKLKIRSRRKVFRKYGGNLTIEENGKTYKLNLHKSLSAINKFNSTKLTAPYEAFNYSLRTKSTLGAPCSICGSLEQVEMHHRRPLRKKITDNTLKGIEINLSRKQIPLCRPCHMRVHKGEYDGPGIY